MGVQFEGVAHPRPGTLRTTPADLSAAEIRSTNLGRGNTPVLVDHSGSAVGSVLASWEGKRGEMRLLAQVDDADAEREIRTRRMGELSLGTSVYQNGKTNLHRRVDEVSICEKGVRDRCLIELIDGKRVAYRDEASRSAGGALRCLIKAPLANLCVLSTRANTLAHVDK